MLKRKIIKPFVLVIMSLVMVFQTLTLNVLSGNTKVTNALPGNTNVAVAKTSDSEESSILDGILNLVGEKGSEVIKDALPTVGDYLCSKIFDYIGIDYTDSYTKELKQVNEKLKNIQTDLQTIIKNQNRGNSQNTIDSFFNIVDTFSTTIHPLYESYNELIRQEKNNELTDVQMQKEERTLYNNLDKIVFGNGTSTGDLYLQLMTLLNKIIEPNRTINKTLMEHYIITFENRWAFDTQSFAPKKEFLGYVTTTAMEGLMLYIFKHLYGIKISEVGSVDQNILLARWNELKSKLEAALTYLQKEIKAVDKEKKTSDDTNTIIHYSTGKKLSKKLYLGNFQPTSVNNHYTYESYYSTTRQGNMRTVKIQTLNNRAFINTIQNDFAKYKKNYKTGNSFTIQDYLKEVGFQCDNWNNQGLYRGQSHAHSGVVVSNEYWKFFLEYTDKYGNAKTEKWGDVKFKVFGSPKTNKNSVSDFVVMSFIGADGKLIGSYETIYEDNGNTVVDRIHYLISEGYHSSGNVELGKVW